jgi:hypothetical protein
MSLFLKVPSNAEATMAFSHFFTLSAVLRVSCARRIK